MNQMDSVAAYGVNPPDLSNAGVIYNSKFLVDLMLNPNHAVHKRLFAMPPLVATIQDASDILAYLKSIAPKHIAPKKAFESACGRCHSLKYAKWTQIGFIPPTKPNFRTGKNIDLLKFKLDEAKYQDYLTRYLGKLPPDLSEIVYKYDDNFLEKFIADPKAVKKDTLMLRTGITKRTYYKIIDYLKKVSN
jgi:ubiquinol-cytochrome c reductase cytochrome c1 subunit